MRLSSLFLVSGLIALATAGPAAAALPAPVESGRFTFDRSQVLPTLSIAGAPILAAGGIREGGLSALEVVPGTGNRRWISVSDRGPNGQPDAAANGRTFLAPGFAPIIYELEADDDGRLSVISRLQMRTKVNNPRRVAEPAQFPGDPRLITGIRNAAPAGGLDRVDDLSYFMTGQATVGPAYANTDPYGLDPEGIVKNPRDGSYWVAEEYRTSIARFDAQGEMVQRIVPAQSGALDTDPTAAVVPLSQFYDGSPAGEPVLDEILPAEYRARRANRGLEGLTASADGTRLYAIMQSPLNTRSSNFGSALGYGDRCEPTTEAGGEDPGDVDWYRNVRIVEIDITQPSAPALTGEWLYRLDSISTSDRQTQNTLRISGLAWSGEGRLLVAEHDDNLSPQIARNVYEVDLGSATNLQSAPSYNLDSERTPIVTVGAQAPQALGCFFDNGTPAELAALTPHGPVTPLTKSQYLDLTPAGVGFELEKVEGLASLDGVAGVAVLNDNDFGFLQDPVTNIIGIAPNPAEQLRLYTTQITPTTTTTVSGSAKAGGTLTCTPSAFSGSGGTLTYAFTWLRGATPIAGADGRHHTLTSEDVGSTIACRVTARRQAGAVGRPSSASTSAVVGPVADFDTGPAGPAGPPGTPGPAGPKGDRGPAGPLPKVSCKLVKRKVKGRSRTIVRCAVKAGKSAARAMVRSAGRTIASSAVRRGRATLSFKRPSSSAFLVVVDRRGRVVARSRLP